MPIITQTVVADTSGHKMLEPASRGLLAQLISRRGHATNFAPSPKLQWMQPISWSSEEYQYE